MKKIITLLLLVTHLQMVCVPANMIINRTGQAITVNYFGGSTPLFTTGAILVTSDPTHQTDQMLVIPSTALANPNSSSGAKYQASATSATIIIGNASITIPSLSANTSYVISTGSTAGTFLATPGLITYDTVTGASIPGSPSPVAPGAGF